jgi:hypothetical protein
MAARGSGLAGIADLSSALCAGTQALIEGSDSSGSVVRGTTSQSRRVHAQTRATRRSL